MSVEELKKYTLRAKYARFNHASKRRETFAEATNRVRDMMLGLYPGISDYVNTAYDAVLGGKLLGSQRALQFGGRPALQHNARVYNCTSSYCDRLRFFQEAFYLLLCGCGVGFSVQFHHVAKLPAFQYGRRNDLPRPQKTFVVPDTIEGWADASGVLMSSYFENGPFPEYAGYDVVFDYSQIRPEGAYLSSGAGRAPGPEPLRRSIEKVRELLDRCVKSGLMYLRPIDAYDIVMHFSDAVLAGGVRRSATICLFSPNDVEMAKSKTGNWFIDNPQRARSNNSALLLRGKTTKAEFEALIAHTREFGEPGFYWSDSTEQLPNPCVEIGFWPRLAVSPSAPETKALLKSYDGPVDYASTDPAFRSEFVEDEKLLLSGWQFCNLTTINGQLCKTPDDFYYACENAAVIGTCQAGMTTFKYLGPVTEQIVRREALLGVSITGIMDSPSVLLDPHVLRTGAAVVKRINRIIAKLIGINPAARLCCVKPEGTASCLLGTGSGCHLWHAKKFLRHVQANVNEVVYQHFKAYNPHACEKSVWCQNNKTDVIAFCLTAPFGAKLKSEMGAVEFLGVVKLLYENWVVPGSNPELSTRPWLTHNVSNTVHVQPTEWDDVVSYIYEHRASFAGISLLGATGDKDYEQAPFVAVKTKDEILKEYGIAHVSEADGSDTYELLVDLINEKLLENQGRLFPYCDELVAAGRDEEESERLKRFTYLLKDIYYCEKWALLTQSYAEVDYSTLVENEDNTQPSGEAACGLGGCDL